MQEQGLLRFESRCDNEQTTTRNFHTVTGSLVVGKDDQIHASDKVHHS